MELDLNISSQYTKIGNVDFVYQKNDGKINPEILPRIESGTIVSCDKADELIITAGFTQKLRHKGTLYAVALIVSALIWFTTLFGVLSRSRELELNSYCFIFITPLFILLFAVMIMKNRRVIQKLTEAPIITVRNYTVCDKLVYYDCDSEPEYYIMLERFAVCIGNNPNKYAAFGMPLSAAVIELEGDKYFTLLK